MKRLPINKELRKKVLEKFSGRCAYCGIPLTEKFHVDHLKPVQHFWKSEEKSQVNELSNLMPACASCNNFKTTFDLEQFRRELESQVDRARKYSVNFRLAERFKLISVSGSKITFFFEWLALKEVRKSESEG